MYSKLLLLVWLFLIPTLSSCNDTVVPASVNNIWISKPLSCCNEKWSQFVKQDAYNDLKLSIQGIDYYLAEMGAHEHLYTKEDLAFNQQLIDRSIKKYFFAHGITIHNIKRIVTNKNEDKVDYDGLLPTKIYLQINNDSFDDILKIDPDFRLESDSTIK